VAFEKSLRLETGNPRREHASVPECRRTKKNDWRDHTREIWKRSFAGVETPPQFPEAVAPSSEFAECTFKHTDVSKNQQEAVKKRAGEAAIREEEASFDVTFYTDGSADDSNRNGGAGVVIVSKDSPDEALELSFPTGRWTSSFQAEMTAIEHALAYASEHCSDKARIRIVTDSKSSVERCGTMTVDPRIETGNEKAILESLRTLGAKEVQVLFLWCPSHCGEWGNEAADAAADE
jgi:ribonuclease HI